jgi:hypothetical protein
LFSSLLMYSANAASTMLCIVALTPTTLPFMSVHERKAVRKRRVFDSSRFGVNILFEVFCQVLHDKDVFTLDVGRRWSRLKAN